MPVNFEKNSYVKGINENEDLKDNKKIFDYAKKNQQFTYGNVTRQKFNTNYSAKNWFGRKIIALPAAVWSGAVKTVYHLAKAIVIGIPKASSDQGRYLKAHCFCVIRDFQESYGRLTSFFNDRYGQFHIQESQFQKTCYSCFATNATLGKGGRESVWGLSVNRPISNGGKNLTDPKSKTSWSWSRSYISKYGVMVDDDAKKVSLSEYKNKTAEERNNLVQRFNLEQISSKLSSSNMSLDDFVNQADTETLKDLTLEDVIIPIQHSKLKFALLDEQKFNALTIGDLQEGINQDQHSFIKQRLAKLPKNEEMQKAIDDYSDVKEIPLKDLAQINASDINKHKEKMPGAAFAFFKSDQIRNLKLSEMQASQNKALFFALDEVEAKERIALFDNQDVIDGIHKGLFTGKILRSIGDEYVGKLKLAQLSKDQVSEIFCWKEKRNSDARCFKAFTVDDVQQAIEAGILTSTYQLKLLSDEQLRGIQLSRLSQETIKNMFPHCPDNTADRERFAYFAVAEVQTALNSGRLISTYQLNLLSDEQLKGVQLSRLSRETIKNMFPYCPDNTADRKRFAHFVLAEVQAALNSGLLTNTYHLKLLSDKQLKGVQLSRLSQEIIKNMFPYCSDNTADRKQFAHFERAEVQGALNSGLLTNTYHLKLLSDEQLKGVQLSRLSKETIYNMFPYCSDNTADRKRFAHFAVAEAQGALYSGLFTHPYQLKLLSDEQLKGVQLSRLSKETINNMFPYCSDNTADRNRFANFEIAEVQAALASNKLNNYQIGLISIEQHNFSTVSQEVINMLFPPHSVDDLREKHSSCSRFFTMENGKVLENRKEKKCNYTEEQLQKMSRDQKQKNDQLLGQLSSKQRQDLESRLYQKDNSATSPTRGNPQPDFASFDSLFGNSFRREFGNFFQHEFGQGFFGGSDPFSQFFGGGFAFGPELNQDESYAALGLKPGATPVEIKNAYKKLALLYHMDKNPRRSDESEAAYKVREKECNEKFINVSKAYAALTQNK